MSSEKIPPARKIPASETEIKQWRPGIRHPEAVDSVETIDSSDDNVPESGPLSPSSREAHIAELKAKIDALQNFQKTSLERFDKRQALKARGRLAEAAGEGPGTGNADTSESAKETIPAPPSAAESPRVTAKEGLLGMGINPHLEKISGGSKSKRAEKAPEPEIDESLSHKDKKILRLALSTRGPEAMKELQKQMKLDTTPGSKRTKDAHRTESLIHAEKMLDSESAYFAALKKFHKTKGFHSVVGDQFNPDGRKLPPEVQELKNAWIKSRADYAGFMKGSASERHIERHKKDTGKTGALRSHDVMERYQRRFITKEVVLGAEEAEYRSRMEGLSSRDKKGIEKVFAGFKKLSPALRVFSTSAMITGGVAAMTAGSTFFGPVFLALGATSAVTTLAASMAKEGSKTKSVLSKIAGLASVGGIFGFFGDKAVRGGHGLAGTKDKAGKKLAQRGGLGDLSNPNTFKGVAGDRRKAMLAQERIDRDARLGRIAAATAAGAAIGGALHTLDHGVGHGTSGVPHEQPMPHSESLSIGEKVGNANINDADKLIGHFAEKLQKDFPVGTVRPPAVEKFLASLQADHGGSALAHEDRSSIFDMHFEGHNGISTVMQPGDKISFDHGHIILDRPGHPEMSHVLVNEQGDISPVDEKVWHQAMPHPHAAEAAKAPESTPTSVAEAVPANPISLDSLQNEYTHLADIQKNSPESSDYLNALEVYQNHLHTYSNLNQPTIPETHSAVAAAPVEPPTVSVEPHSVEAPSDGIEQTSRDAYEAAKAAPAGTEIPYVSHGGGSHWNEYVSLGNGKVQHYINIDEANGQPLLPPSE